MHDYLSFLHDLTDNLLLVNFLANMFAESTTPYIYVLTGTYIDKKCPFTGTVSIRGRILAGTCHSAKMVRSIVVRRNYLHFVKKYQRHDPASSCNECFSFFFFSLDFLNLRRHALFVSSDMRRGTQTFPHTSLRASVWRKEIMSSLANAG